MFLKQWTNKRKDSRGFKGKISKNASSRNYKKGENNKMNNSWEEIWYISVFLKIYLNWIFLNNIIILTFQNFSKSLKRKRFI